MVGTRGRPVHIDPEPCPLFSGAETAACRLSARVRCRFVAILGRRTAAVMILGRRTAVMAREPGKPCFRCHPRPIGDGGTWIPAADGHDERLGTAKTKTNTQRYERNHTRNLSRQR